MKSLTLLFVLFLAFGSLAQNPSDTINKFNAAGQKHGYWIKYVNDTIKYEGRFINGVPDGHFIYYYPDSTIKAEMQYSGSNSSTVLFFPGGAKMAEGAYVDKQKDGKWLYYDGYGHVISEENYKIGVKHGQFITYYQEGGTTEVIEYKDGVKDGVWIQYFPNGNVKFKCNYTNGYLDGLFNNFYPEGKAQISGTYKMGFRHGAWILLDDLGQMIYKETYREGIQISREVYQKDKDPQTTQQEDSQKTEQNKGNTSPDNGTNDPRFE